MLGQVLTQSPSSTRRFWHAVVILMTPTKEEPKRPEPVYYPSIPKHETSLKVFDDIVAPTPPAIIATSASLAVLLGARELLKAAYEKDLAKLQRAYAHKLNELDSQINEARLREAND